MKGSTILILAGLGIAVVGIILRWFPGLFSWFGNLPGDIRYQGENTRVFVPLTSMILLSVVATVVLNILVRLFRDQ